MDYFLTSSSKRVQRQSTNKHRGKRLTQEQVNVLERNFMTSDKKLDPERKLQLATELGVPPRQVAIWYQNKRARWKTQTLEIDYNALQVRLDATLSEKKVVERDLERLRSELRRTQEVLPLTSLAPTPSSNNFLPHPHPKDTVSGSCEEGGGSSNNSFNGDLDVNCGWEDENKALQLDDLYACMMFPNGSGRLD